MPSLQLRGAAALLAVLAFSGVAADTGFGAAPTDEQENRGALSGALGLKDGAVRSADSVVSEALANLSNGPYIFEQAVAAIPELPPAGGGGPADARTRSIPEASAGLPPTMTTAPRSGRATILTDGSASPPGEAPPRVQAVINAANLIDRAPYLWGGGHASWFAGGYDCSGAVSFALYGGGFLGTPLASGQFESWGAPGPGRWITVYANAGHAFAEIAGLRWDTVGDARGTGPRWHTEVANSAGFVARHPVGY